MVIAQIDNENDCSFAIQFADEAAKEKVIEFMEVGLEAWYAAAHPESWDKDYWSKEEVEDFYWKGYAEPTLFDETDERMQHGAWYDFKLQFNTETETVIKLWAEINGEFDEAECPDWNSYTYLSFDSSDLISQIKQQLKENFGMELKDLKEEKS